MIKIRYPMTWCIVGITSLITMLQFAYDPEILALFRRNPQELLAGEWWRIITPLLVHADGWGQYVFNIASIIVIGIEIEYLVGKYKFFILYLAGGLIGEIAGYASWDPYGAGASVGMCGLAGGLFIIMLSRKQQPHLIPAMFSLYIVVGLVGFASENIYITISLFIAVSIFSGMIMSQNQRSELLGIFSGVCGLLGGIVLFMLQDIHGAAILAGIITTLLLYFRRSD